MGVVKGFPDYVILTKRRPLFIEMKRTKKSSISEEQKTWHRELQRLNLSVHVCKGFAEARQVIEEAIA